MNNLKVGQIRVWLQSNIRFEVIKINKSGSALIQAYPIETFFQESYGCNYILKDSKLLPNFEEELSNL